MRTLICHFFFILLSLPVLTGQEKLPESIVNDLNDQPLDIAKYTQDGKPKIISLWATWCGPCRMELNALKKVYPKWKQLYNIEIIAITVDYASMLKRAKKMFADNEWEYTFFHDQNQELMEKLGIRGIPYSMLIDGSGVIRSVQMGYYPGYEKEIEKKLKSLKTL